MNGPIHVAVTRRVRAGCEPEFEQRLQAFAQRSLTAAGTRGVQLLHPSPGSDSREYGILRTFASAADREAFYNSAMFHDWMAEVDSLVDGEPEYRELTGLEAWFRDPSSPRPPRWKMALLTWLAVWPVSMAVAALLKPLVTNWPNTLAVAFVSAGIVVTLTWVAMPLLVKAAHHWLQPVANQTRRRS